MEMRMHPPQLLPLRNLLRLRSINRLLRLLLPQKLRNLPRQSLVNWRRWMQGIPPQIFSQRHPALFLERIQLHILPSIAHALVGDVVVLCGLVECQGVVDDLAEEIVHVELMECRFAMAGAEVCCHVDEKCVPVCDHFSQFRTADRAGIAAERWNIQHKEVASASDIQLEVTTLAKHW